VAKAQILQETGCSLRKSSRQQTTLPQQQERSPQQQHEQPAPAALPGPEEGQTGNRYGKTQPCTPPPGREQRQSGQYGPNPAEQQPPYLCQTYAPPFAPRHQQPHRRAQAQTRHPGHEAAERIRLFKCAIGAKETTAQDFKVLRSATAQPELPDSDQRLTHS